LYDLFYAGLGRQLVTLQQAIFLVDGPDAVMAVLLALCTIIDQHQFFEVVDIIVAVHLCGSSSGAY
jgi:hypothetical protein